MHTRHNGAAAWRRRFALVSTLVVVASVLPIAMSSAAKPLDGGSYAGKIRPTDASDASSDTKIKFKVNGAGTKIKRLKAELFYGCFIGGSFILQRYVFPSVHKGPVKIRPNGKFSAKDVVDRQTGFIVRFSGKTRGRSKAKGEISLQTTTTGSGCGRDFTWAAKRK